MPSLSLNDAESQTMQQVATRTGFIKNIMSVFGNSGTQHYSGYFMEEPNNKWRDESRVDIVEEMRRTDGAVKAVLNAIKTPINAADWMITGGDEKIREFVKKDIFNLQRRTWNEFVREALAYLDFGHYVFEKIFIKGNDGYIHLADLSPRIPRSIQNWKISGNKPGITQIIRNDSQENKQSTLEIPMYKLLVLTNDKEGDDITGQSILRSAYKHYKYKDLLYRFQGIAAERYAAGIPWIKYPTDFGDTEKQKAEELGSNIRTNEKAYLATPKEWDISILTPDGNPQGAQIEQCIVHHNNMIMLSVLATFLNLGTGDAGSFALSKDQSSFFLKHVEDKCRYFAEQVSEQVIKHLVRLNFGEQEEWPKLSFSPLGDFNLKEMSDIMNTLITAGLVEVTPEMKQFTYKMFKFPQISDVQVEEMKEQELQKEFESMQIATEQDEFAFIDEENPDMAELPEENIESDDEADIELKS